MLELSKLAEKDPEFYKYLQEHDRDLLGFNVADDGDDVEDVDDDVGEPDATQLPTLTKNILRTWQKSLLEVGKSPSWFGTVALMHVLQTRSLRALRKLLVAFRSAVFMNEEDRVLAWTIDSPTGGVSSLSFNVQ
jgi:nucleolar complex protein 2